MGANLFSIGRSGLNAAKKSLATTSHNIANANTEGFSRQRVSTQTNPPVGTGDDVYGTGTSIQNVKRVHDRQVEKRLNHSLSSFNYHESRYMELGQVEQIFNEVNSEGLNKLLNKFFNSFRELSNQPENETMRAIVRDNANLIVNDIKRVNESLRQSKDAIDNKLENSIKDVNSLAFSIAKLNKQIIMLEAGKGETGDLRDQRDQAVRDLAEFFDIQTYQDEKGRYVVNIKGAGSLVAGGAVNEVSSGQVMNVEGLPPNEGIVELYLKGRNTPITKRLQKGKLGALAHTRNHEIHDLRSKINSLTFDLANTVNAIHRRGFINKPIPTDAQGNPINTYDQPFTGIDFFKISDDKTIASATISLSDDIRADLDNIATGLAPNAPGDNRISIAISKLQNEKVLGSGNTTFEEEYLKAVGTIGLRTAKSQIDMEQAQGILAQTKSIKERISGVSLDEETANMVRYQHAYDASAKVIKTADETFDSLIGMMR